VPSERHSSPGPRSPRPLKSASNARQNGVSSFVLESAVEVFLAKPNAILPD